MADAASVERSVRKLGSAEVGAIPYECAARSLACWLPSALADTADWIVSPPDRAERCAPRIVCPLADETWLRQTWHDRLAGTVVIKEIIADR